MTRITIATAAVALALAAHAGAQTKTVPGTTQTVTVTVDAIDFSQREVTVTKPDKSHDVIYVPMGVKRFDTLKVGDKITATYYENMVLQVKAPGDKDVNTDANAINRKDPVGTGGTVAHQRTITATITAIDMNTPSITFTGPQNWKYSTKVKDKAALSKVKVGDKVDITWTEALLVSIQDAK